jgi:hypothetical protein
MIKMGSNSSSIDGDTNSTMHEPEKSFTMEVLNVPGAGYDGNNFEHLADVPCFSYNCPEIAV